MEKVQKLLRIRLLKQSRADHPRHMVNENGPDDAQLRRRRQLRVHDQSPVHVFPHLCCVKLAGYQLCESFTDCLLDWQDELRLDAVQF